MNNSNKLLSIINVGLCIALLYTFIVAVPTYVATKTDQLNTLEKELNIRCEDYNENASLFLEQQRAFKKEKEIFLDQQKRLDTEMNTFMKIQRDFAKLHNVYINQNF